MADEAEDIDGEEDELEGEPKKKMGLMKLGLFIGLPAVILILGAVAAFLVFSGGGDEHVVAEGEPGGAHGEASGGHAEAPADAMYYPLDDENETAILVNIQSNGGRSPLLKLELWLEFSDPEVQQALDTHLARVYDQYLVFLRELRVEDLSGSAGTYRLKMELLRRVNLAIAPLQVDDVLIQSMLIQ